MKIFKKILILTILTILTSCGYTPMYKDLKNLNYSITIKETSGDRKINNIIKSKLNSYTVKEADKNYDITFNSKYIKEIVAKDTTGAATEYKILIKTKFIIDSKKLNKELNYTESFNMKKINDRLEEEDYEKNIQNSLVNIITRKLILQLSQIQ